MKIQFFLNPRQFKLFLWINKACTNPGCINPDFFSILYSRFANTRRACNFIAHVRYSLRSLVRPFFSDSIPVLLALTCACQPFLHTKNLTSEGQCRITTAGVTGRKCGIALEEDEKSRAFVDQKSVKMWKIMFKKKAHVDTLKAYRNSRIPIRKHLVSYIFRAFDFPEFWVSSALPSKQTNFHVSSVKFATILTNFVTSLKHEM